MDSQTYQLGFIGAGKLAGSVIRGLVLSGFCSPSRILASEPNDQVRNALVNETAVAVAGNNAEAASQAEVVFIGLKPALVVPVLRDLREAIRNKIVISLAAGVRFDSMERVANARWIRALTNTPSAICRAATALAKGPHATVEDLALARKIFEAVGLVIDVDETHIDAVTALSGSGPAFVYSVIEALADGGKTCGLPPNVAGKLAAQTVLGAAELAIQTGLSPQELRKMVVTPGGTTAAGLGEMAKHRTAEGLIAAVVAATKRGQEMARENQ
ncbi:MAG TPA: pyrroline-5-carboxylate reductase [Chthoniobacterales bacterium]|jgi:pyrroline-5-carboxylate reductase